MVDRTDILCHSIRMNKATSRQVAKLVAFFGSNPEVARHIGIDPRSFRRCCRVHMSNTTRHLVQFASNALYLRLLLQALRKGGAVSEQELRVAITSVNRLLSPKGQAGCENEGN